MTNDYVQPMKLTWNPNIEVLKMSSLFQGTSGHLPDGELTFSISTGTIKIMIASRVKKLSLADDRSSSYYPP